MTYLIIGFLLPFCIALICRIFKLNETDTYCVMVPCVCVSMFINIIGLCVLLGVIIC